MENQMYLLPTALKYTAIWSISFQNSRKTSPNWALWETDFFMNSEKVLADPMLFQQYQLKIIDDCYILIFKIDIYTPGWCLVTSLVSIDIDGGNL